MRRALWFGVAGVTVLGLLQGPPAAAPAGKETPPPSSSRLRELQRERVKALETQVQGQFERVKIGKDPLIQYIEAIRELGDAELELAETREARLAAVEKMVKELTDCEEQIVQLQQAGLQT